MNSFYGQTQFRERFGVYDPASKTKQITPEWQSGLTNSALVGQLAGLVINGYCQDKFGSRRTYMFFQVWMAIAIFIPVFTPSLDVLGFGEAMCGIPWGVFQTLSTTYASEIVPTVLRPYVTAFVCMCWGGGQLLSSGVIRAITGVEGNMAWRIPFMLQWVWPVPLFIAGYFCPESPWNAVRRGQIDVARTSLARLRGESEDKEEQVEAALAYIRHTTALEEAESEGASFLECFQGTNLRRTEIVRHTPWILLPLNSANTSSFRTALFGLLRFFAETLFLDTQLSSSSPPGSPRSRPSTSTSRSLRATSSVASFAGSSSRTSAGRRST